MNIIRCLQKLQPNWNGVVWGNCYEGIKPNETEKRPIPTFKELEAVWPVVEQEMNTAIQVAKSGKEAKDKAIAEILPSFDAVQKNISDTKDIEGLKKIVTDLAKIIYMTVKGAV